MYVCALVRFIHSMWIICCCELFPVLPCSTLHNAAKCSSPHWYKRLVFTIYLSISSSFPLYDSVKLVWLSVCLVIVFITFHFNSIRIKKLNFYEIYQFKFQSRFWFRIYRCAIDFAILFSLFFRVYGSFFFSRSPAGTDSVLLYSYSRVFMFGSYQSFMLNWCRCLLTLFEFSFNLRVACS